MDPVLRRGLSVLGTVALLAGVGFLFLQAAVWLAFRSPPFRVYPPDETDIALLAQDVHLKISGVSLVLPLAALRNEARFDAFRTDRGEDWRKQEAAARAAFADSATDPASPLDQTRVDMAFRAYSWQNTLADARHLDAVEDMVLLIGDLGKAAPHLKAMDPRPA